jgi:hypothetical protein
MAFVNEGSPASPGSAHSGGSADKAALDARWRELTEAGNRAFIDHDDATASQLYGEALAEAERLFELAFASGGAAVLLAPTVHTIACHNAEALKWRTDDMAGGRGLEMRAVERLVATAESAATPLGLCANTSAIANRLQTQLPFATFRMAKTVRAAVGRTGSLVLPMRLIW